MVQETKTVQMHRAPEFARYRRITGYLVGTTSKWNPYKLAELRDRVTHNNDCKCNHD